MIKLLCAECVVEGKKSTVTPLGSLSTLMGWIPYYDEDGVYHSHDPNVRTTSYRCSNGHDWEVKRTVPCPAEGCSYA